MPNLDRTGPLGEGPLTGRKRGRCGSSKKMSDERKIKKNKKDDGTFIEPEYRERSRRRGRFTNRFTGGFSVGKGRGQLK